MLKAVLFDLDNTLYAYAPCNDAGQKAAYRYLSQQLDCSVKHIERSVRRARHEIHHAIPTQAASHSRLLYYLRCTELITGSTQLLLAQQAERIFWKAYLSKMKLRPGVLELFQYYKRNGIKIAIVSDLTTDIQISKIRRLRISRYIDVLVTSEEVGAEKPNPRMVWVALKKLNLTKRHVMMVGDSAKRDAAAAKKLNIPFEHETTFFKSLRR